MFLWDHSNLDRIALHSVGPEEAEEALLDPDRYHIGTQTVGGERRQVYIGATQFGRALVVVYVRRERLIRVVTCRPATESEVRRWRRSQR
jgi:uncharacterized DUF497 family protein